MGLFSKEECAFCGNKVGFFKRKRLVNKEGYICKECEKKCSCLINVGRFTKTQIEEHMKYMERQNKLYEEAFATLDKDKKERYMSINTGIEFADEIAMFRYVSPDADKKLYKELFRYDQIRSYEPYKKENTNQQNGDKKYSEVGVLIHLYSSWDEYGRDMNEYANNRSYHPYVTEIRIPTARNVDDFSHIGVKDKLDKIFGVYEDNSLIGGIKSSIMGTNQQRAQMKVASEGLKALGSFAKSKITGNEEDSDKAKENWENLKEDAINLATNNRAAYTVVANDVEDRILGKE